VGRRTGRHQGRAPDQSDKTLGMGQVRLHGAGAQEAGCAGLVQDLQERGDRPIPVVGGNHRRSGQPAGEMTM